MRRKTVLAAACVSALLIAAPVTAAEVEIGSSLASGMIGLGDNDFSTFGIPSSGFGVISPGVYAAFYATPNVALEPQVGLIVASSGGSSEHVLNVAGQLDYFLKPSGEPAPFVFAFAGLLDSSGSGVTPKTVGAGAGYRVPVGDRLAFRFDGRYTHYTEQGGNSLTFTLSIGGVLGQR